MNHGDDRQGRSGWNNNRAYDNSRRVTLASASKEDLRSALDERRGSRKPTHTTRRVTEVHKNT